MVLVNLTCGRNPWKRASAEDATFRAYLRDPDFLRSILPLSPELDAILRRVFEVDPSKRIGIAELRDLIERCPRLTMAPAASTPSSVADDYHKLSFLQDCHARMDVDAWQPPVPADSSMVLVSPLVSAYGPMVMPAAVAAAAAAAATSIPSADFTSLPSPVSASSSSSSSSTFYSASACSDSGSVLSTLSSTSSASSPSAVAREPTKPATTTAAAVPGPVAHAVGPCVPYPVSPTFYGSFFLPALDLMGRRLPLQSCALGVRVH